MTNEEKQPFGEVIPRKVEELVHFPFHNFKEFINAYLKGGITIEISNPSARFFLEMVESNPNKISRMERNQIKILELFPLLAPIGFIVYTIITHDLRLLWTFPVIIVTFFTRLSRYKNLGLLIFLITSGLIWFYFTGNMSGFEPVAVTVSLILLSRIILHSKAVNYAISAVLQNEETLCLLWHNKGISIMFRKGSIWRAD